MPSSIDETNYLNHKSQYRDNKEMTEIFETIESKPGLYLIDGEAGTAKSSGVIKGFMLMATFLGIPAYITATTNNAAHVNIKNGVDCCTIHRNFGSIGDHILNTSKDDIHKHLSKTKKFAKLVKDIIENNGILVIDEVSMLHQNFLNGIILSIIIIAKNNREELGIIKKSVNQIWKELMKKIRIILVGGFQQLNPINNWYDYNGREHKKEFEFIKDHILGSDYITYHTTRFTLKKNYRQNEDEIFSKVLKSMSENKISEIDLTSINKCVTSKTPDQIYKQYPNSIIAIPFKKSASELNRKINSESKNKSFISTRDRRMFTGDINHLDSLQFYNKDINIIEGSSMILTENLDVENGFYNNSSVKIKKIIDFDKIEISNNSKSMTINKYEYKIPFNPKKGIVTQFPLREGPASTFHTLQGATLEDGKIIIDMSSMDAAGITFFDYASGKRFHLNFLENMLYVALSRVKKFSQVVICTPEGRKLTKKHLKINQETIDWLNEN